MRRPLMLLLLAAAPALAANFPPSPVVFPDQRLPLKFSHKQHLGFKLQCDFCHDRAESSTSAKDDLVPSEEVCRTCHKIERDKPNKQAVPSADCASCHAAGPTERVAIPPPNLKFNHKVHADRQIPCAKCHGDLAQVDLATRDQLPKMSLCLGCHNSTAQAHRAPAKCTTCHLARQDGTLETVFASGTLAPSGTLRGDAHTPQFSVEHARVAQNDEGYCLSCHRRDYCLSCHNGVVKPMSFHGNDYVSIHAVDARKATTDCNGCHRRQSFCLGCHERSGVIDQATANAPGSVPNTGKRFHPPYQEWVAAPRGPNHHSWQAERNVKTCVSCHREDTCLQCHSTATGSNHPFNVSPHPAGFANSRMCQALASRNARVCLKCHATFDQHLTCR